MNTAAEIYDAFDGKPRDYAPPAVFTQTGTVSQMDSCGSSWPEANYDSEKMARLSLEFSKKYGFATAKVPFCITVMPERFGCRIHPGCKDGQPTSFPLNIESNGMGLPEVPDLISPEEFVSGGRIPLVLDAEKRVKKENEDLFVIAGLEDPVATVGAVVGVENMLMAMMIEPDSIAPWVEKVTPCVCEYARLLSELADDVQMIVLATDEMTTKDCFIRYVEPSARDVIRSCKESLVTIHSCGFAEHVLERLASLGEDGLSIETHRDPQGAVDIVGKHTRLIGGVPPVAHLLCGTPETVVDDAIRASDLGYDIIAPECGVPPTTPDANLLALSEYRSR